MVHEEGDILTVMFKSTLQERKAKIVKVDLPWIQVRFMDGRREYYSFRPENKKLLAILSHEKPPRLMKAVSRIPLPPITAWRSGRKKR